MTAPFMSMSTSFSAEKLKEHASQGLELSFWTFVLTIVLELWCVDTVQKLLDQKGGGKSLYISAVLANVRNHFAFGWPIYVAAANLFCREAEEITSSNRVTGVITILFVQSICFYGAHRAFHSNPAWYRHHRFHHRFNTHVPPMAANAVSPVEYIVAYILPLILATPFVQTDTVSLRIAAGIVSVTNLMIHTPKLSSISEKLMPEWLVSTEDHLEHHRKLNTKYAAPTFNIDYFVDCIERRFLPDQPSLSSSSSPGIDCKTK